VEPMHGPVATTIAQAGPAARRGRQAGVGDVPVHVSVTLLASETEQIYTFGRYCRGYRSRDTMHNGLQS
jgi:hypothetical protein